MPVPAREMLVALLSNEERGGADASPLLDEKSVTIGITMIAGGDHIDSLQKLLPQLAKMDQVVICDTSKKGVFRKIVSPLGAPYEYHKVTWRKDAAGRAINDWGFSWARNQSLKYIKTTHAVWIDADDMIGFMRGSEDVLVSADVAYNAFLKVAKEAPDVDVWYMPYVYSRDIYNNPNVIHYRERMIKMSTGWRWVYPIHEVLVPDSKPKQSEVKDVQIIHFPRNNDKSGIRNLEYLLPWREQLEAEESPDIVRCDLEIGMTYWGLAKFRECATYLDYKFLRLYPNAMSLERWTAWIYVAKSQMELRNIEAAKAAALAAIE